MTALIFIAGLIVGAILGVGGLLLWVVTLYEPGGR